MHEFRVDLNHCDERLWFAFEDFTKTKTKAIVQEIQNGTNPEDIQIDFLYESEGTTLLIDGKWYINAIHQFANKYNIPLYNITVVVTNAKCKDVYNKWHSLYCNDSEKINLRLSNFGIRLYRSDKDIFIPTGPNIQKRTKKFNCLNANMLPHRMMMLKEFYEQDMLDTENNLISFHHYIHHGKLPAELEAMCPIQFDIVGTWDELYGKLFHGKEGFIRDWNKVGDYSHIYENTYFTVTTESSECYTLCDYHDDEEINSHMRSFHEELFLTEKIFRPMLYWHPQLVQCSTGTLDYLKQLGFKTFNNYWNEDYDNEPNGELRTKMIVDETKKLANKSLDELHEMYIDMLPILDHNHKLITNYDYENIRSAWYKTS